MADQKCDTSYKECGVHNFQLYLEHSKEHQAMMQVIDCALPAEFKRIGEGKSSVDVLGVGSGGGEMDVHILKLLKQAVPNVPIKADAIEGSVELTKHFKALVDKNLKDVPVTFHCTTSEEYMTQAKTRRDLKRFDFIHMIQMIYYLEDMPGSIKFYHGLLKENGRLMIIVEAAKGGWDTLWKTYKNELCTHDISEYRSSGEVTACLDSLGLKYDVHKIPNEFDISECMCPEKPKNKFGHDLINFITARGDFYEELDIDTRKKMLDDLKNKCSTQKDGKVMFNSELACILVHS